MRTTNITTTANKWGTSYGIRITKGILEHFPMNDKERLDVHVDGDKLIFTKSKETIKHKKLEDLLKERGWDGDESNVFETEPIVDLGFAGEEVPL